MTKLEEIDGIQNLNTCEVTNMGFTFLSCILLQSLDLSGFDVSQVSNTTAMFNGCSSLKTIYSDNTWNIAASEKMFYGCYNLVGAASFSSSKDGGEMANPVTGYFTSSLAGSVATGIDNVQSSSFSVHPESWYTLDGRKLRGMPTQRGIYVSNGKRIIIK
jgi:surface protein